MSTRAPSRGRSRRQWRPVHPRVLLHRTSRSQVVSLHTSRNARKRESRGARTQSPAPTIHRLPFLVPSLAARFLSSKSIWLARIPRGTKTSASSTLRRTSVFVEPWMRVRKAARCWAGKGCLGWTGALAGAAEEEAEAEVAVETVAEADEERTRVKGEVVLVVLGPAMDESSMKEPEPPAEGRRAGVAPARWRGRADAGGPPASEEGGRGTAT